MMNMGLNIVSKNKKVTVTNLISCKRFEICFSKILSL